MNFIAIIPARYASTRFPGKPLALIAGKPMIQHVYERCKELMEHVYVATDDDRIVQTVNSFGGSCILTDSKHPSGTDRVAEAAKILAKSTPCDVVINVQGDEPFLQIAQIEQLMNCFYNSSTDIATLVTPIKSAQILTDPNKVKAVVAANGRALYFSRSPVPFLRDFKLDEWLEHQAHFLHLGLYAYRTQVLNEITRLTPSPLENMEKLEQLRWLENGYIIQTAVTTHENFGVDTPADLQQLNEQLNNNTSKP
jgi:3-deoxy-manno-octulosonate cytidylyltransferase (CMP-KDO synthetase)